MTKKVVADGEAPTVTGLPRQAYPLATYSRHDVQVLRKKAAAAERAVAKTTARAAVRGRGDPKSGMTPRQRQKYEDMQRGAAALTRLFETARDKDPNVHIVITEEDRRIARQHFRTAAEQVAKLFRKKRVGGEQSGKGGSAKARSH
jgi:hypothetical protein